jgi:uncharacterized membrane protein
MLGRHRRKFLERIDRDRVEEAIRAAERTTAAPIRVAVLPRVRGSLSRVADLTAARLGVTELPARNGVLIVVVPGRREFHVWGDLAAHEKTGPAFWTSVARTISTHFREGGFTDGLVAGIEETARELAGHFPR